VNSLFDMFNKSASAHPDRIAIRFGEQTLTYAVLKDAVDRLSAGLIRLQFNPGERIAVMLPNIPHYPIAYLSVLKNGCVVVPVFLHCTIDEIHHQLEEAEIRGIIYWEGYRDNVVQIVRGLERCQKKMVLGEKATAGEIRLNYLMEIHAPMDAAPSVSPGDTAVIVYTDRMKGRSKGAELTHGNLVYDADACSRFLKLTPEDGTLAVIPLYHMLGQTLVMNAFLSSGAQMVLMPRFNPEAVGRAFQDTALTHFIGVPYMFQALLQSPQVQPEQFESVKTCISSGDALKQDVLDAFEQKFHVKIVEGYGLTEASPMVTFYQGKGEHKAGSIGNPLPGIDFKVVDEGGNEVTPGETGEIIVHGPNVMKGYLNRPEATKEALKDGWLYTGDMAVTDENGNVSVVARKHSIIVKSGFSIQPNEVEEAILAHPEVAESVVVGLPDPVHGEDIHACVVLKDGETVLESDLLAMLKEEIPVYKCPKTVTFVAALPKGPTGRVIRDQVKQMLLPKGNPNP
jgi:long-chain acyl-CoA synthetase